MRKTPRTCLPLRSASHGQWAISVIAVVAWTPILSASEGYIDRVELETRTVFINLDGMQVARGEKVIVVANKEEIARLRITGIDADGITATAIVVEGELTALSRPQTVRKMSRAQYVIEQLFGSASFVIKATLTVLFFAFLFIALRRVLDFE